MSLKSPPCLSQLAEAGPLAIFLDFDGTLVEIAPTHDTIEVPRALPAALVELARRLDERVALVSGRSLEDLAKHLGELAIARAGSHGADCRLADGTQVGEAPQQMPGEVTRALTDLVERFPGATLETKDHGAAVHYRACPQEEDAIVEQVQMLAGNEALAVKCGKCVIEVLSGRADKGAAVDSFMALPEFAGAIPVFVGDDITDEDGFRAVNQMDGIAVLVGGARETEACYRLDGPDDVYRWLELEIE